MIEWGGNPRSKQIEIYYNIIYEYQNSKIWALMYKEKPKFSTFDFH